MKEKVFNIFLFINLNDEVEKFGVVVHEIDGTDKQKIEYLRRNCDKDIEKVDFFDIPENIKLKRQINYTENIGIPYHLFQTMEYDRTDVLFFEEIFNKYGATGNPLYMKTPVVNGEIRIEGFRENLTTPDSMKYHSVEIEYPGDYLIKYMKNEGFALDELINDDFFKAVKLLFKEGLYVSSAKLLMSCIDSIAFLEYGDQKGIFQLWLKNYCDLSKVEISEDELWEFRNSILHMSNYDSRKVLNKKVKRLILMVNPIDDTVLNENSEGKMFDLPKLIFEVAKGIGNWVDSINENRDKLKIIVNRYDRVVSDSRFTTINYK